ncbi:hypothetical protein QAD02_013212 [Eretmocerus hayati]|uniref:Uncharacterized protein n=1 Tax=Eretmocerus hayati TaxID=131215 RepID=A0ACC2P1G3_9HYME|nr:hypothetical protein QAD02_013212 [Eretmocerus hayati]
MQLYKVQGGDKFHCYSCPNKGPSKESFALCNSCEASCHPSCAERRAGPRDDGSFATCCPNGHANPSDENRARSSASNISEEAQKVDDEDTSQTSKTGYSSTKPSKSKFSDVICWQI